METNGTANQADRRPLLDADAAEPAKAKHRKSPAVLTYSQSRTADDWIRAHWGEIEREGLTQRQFAERVARGADLPAFTVNQLRHLLGQMGLAWPGSKPVNPEGTLEAVLREFEQLLVDLTVRVDGALGALNARLTAIEGENASIQRTLHAHADCIDAGSNNRQRQDRELAALGDRLFEIENRLPPGAARIPVADAACGDLPG